MRKKTEFEKFLKKCKKNLDDARLDMRKLLEHKDIFDSKYCVHSLEREDFIDSLGELILEMKTFLEAYKPEKKKRKEES